MLRFSKYFLILLFLLKLPDAFAAAKYECKFSTGSTYIPTIPQMAVPSDLPDGTVLYKSSEVQLQLECSYDPGNGMYTTGVPILYSTTAAFEDLQNEKNGIRVIIYINDQPISSRSTNVNFGVTSGGYISTANLPVRVRHEIIVDRTRGNIPESGQLAGGSYEALYFYLRTINNLPRATIGFRTPRITAIPCSMDMMISPNTLNWGAIQTSKLDSGQDFSKNFSIILKKRSSCTINSAAPFGVNIWFDRAGESLNPDGSLDLKNGTGLSIKDNSGTVVAYDTYYEIPDVKVESVLTRNFTAQIQKTSGKDLKTGSFSTVLVIRMNYY